jgi:hypothetical protein
MSSEGGFRTVSVLEVAVSYNLARIEVACIASSLHREKKTFKTIRIQSKTYSDPVWRIRDKHPGSRIPDPNFSIPVPFQYINPSLKYDPGCSSRIQIWIFYPSRIPDPKGSIRHRVPDPVP